MTHFTLREKKKIAAVLAAHRDLVQANLSSNGYINDHGGCPNCGDTGGIHTLLYELELAFKLRNEHGVLKVAAPRRAKR